MPKNKLAKPRTIEEIRKSIRDSGTKFDSKHILKLADKELSGLKGPKEFGPDTNLYKATTLLEFDKGFLMMSVVPERYRVFALEFSKNLQSEYQCKTQSEKSIAEVTSLNYVRVLEIQDRINSYLGKGSVSDTGVKFLSVMSKELDRAERHYLSSLQLLRMLKMPPLQMNIKTNTAVVGHNQIVQANTNDKTK